MLGYDIQHSESTPHIQIVADTFAPDPKDDKALRVESSQAWYSHRDVRDDRGRQKSGKTKMQEYHVGLKQQLIGLGYDVSADFDEERRLVGQGKEEYGRSMDAQRVALDRDKSTQKKLAGFRTEVAEVKGELDERHHQVEREGILDRREAGIPRCAARPSMRERTKDSARATRPAAQQQRPGLTRP